MTGTKLAAGRQTKLEALQALPKVAVLQLPSIDGKLPIAALLEELAKRNLTSILVEGGSTVHGDFLEAGLVDRIYAFIAPKLIGGKEALTPGGRQGLCLDGRLLCFNRYRNAAFRSRYFADGQGGKEALLICLQAWLQNLAPCAA